MEKAIARTVNPTMIIGKAIGTKLETSRLAMTSFNVDVNASMDSICCASPPNDGICIFPSKTFGTSNEGK